MLTYSHIWDLIEAKSVEDKSTLEVLRLYEAAMNDWPTEIKSIEDYNKALRCFVGGELKKETIVKQLKEERNVYYAWQLESMSYIVDVFNFYDTGLSLDDIAVDLNKKLQTT